MAASAGWKTRFSAMSLGPLLERLALEVHADEQRARRLRRPGHKFTPIELSLVERPRSRLEAIGPQSRLKCEATSPCVRDPGQRTIANPHAASPAERHYA